MPASAQMPDASFIGRAGSQYISEQEFLQRFELTPGLYRHRKPQLQNEKLAVLYSMIAEKLLAQEAIARHCDEDTVFRLAFRDLTKKIARDQLYRTMVRDSVDIGEKEIRTAMKHAISELRVRYLYFDSLSDAKFVRSRIRTAADFDRMTLDTTLPALCDTATVLWGDADTSIENAAYRLALNQVSSVINAGTGFYIMKVIQKQADPTFSAMQPGILRERVTARIRGRKERWRTMEYLHSELAGKPGYSPPGPFLRLADSLYRVISRPRSEHPTALTPEMVRELQVSLTGHLDDTVIVAGPRIWTIREAIYRLMEKAFPSDLKSRREVQNALYEEFQGMADQELLEQEAVQRGLDTLPEVREELTPWRDTYLSVMMKQKIGSSVRVNDAEVYNYLKSTDSATMIPVVRLRELHVRSLDDIRKITDDLASGLSFASLAGRWSVIPEERRLQGLTDPFPVNTRSPIGEIAWEMAPGQVGGPIEDSSGFMLFELVSKTGMIDSSDTSRIGSFERAKQNLLRMKQRRDVTLFIAQSAAKRGFDIYEDRLKKLEVTAIPMMTYRFLGFGGRIFAVPLVDKQLDWLGVEPPEIPILP